jgi:xanthine dehydrogenase YagR molybdenum-binding subunit
MKFDTPATTNPIDQLKVIGKPVDRIEGGLKVTGTAPFAYERYDVVPHQAYGYPVAAGIAKGRIVSIDVTTARAAPGVLAVVTADNAGRVGKADFYVARPLAGPLVDYYHQAVGVVVAETFEQARVAAQLVRVKYAPAKGAYDLDAARKAGPAAEPGGGRETRVGDFAAAFADAPVKLDEFYTTPDQTHAMMEPHATLAAWEGDKLTLWTSMQMISWAARDLAKILSIPRENIQLTSPHVGGGFGGKTTILADAVLASVAARAVGRPVKVALPRAMIANNTTHRPATIQRLRLGATRDGKLTAIDHEGWSGNIAGGRPESSTIPTRVLYGSANRSTRLHLATLDLPEGNSMRAPGEAPGMMALEIAIDEMAEKLGMDPVEFRIVNDTQVVPDDTMRRPSTDPQSAAKAQEAAAARRERPFSQRRLARPARGHAPLPLNRTRPCRSDPPGQGP